MTVFKIARAAGDGIGPEVVAEADKVLDAVGRRYGHVFERLPMAVGGAAIRAHGVPLRGEDLERARGADALLFGAVGDPRFDGLAPGERPEQAILGLRKGLGLFANLRPVRPHPATAADSPLRPEVLAGTDFVVARELTGGIYFGEPRGRVERPLRRAVDTMVYDEEEVARLLRVGFELARGRRGLLTCVDKANVLATSQLWREVADEVAGDYPDVELEFLLVDACAMELIRAPARFDVIATGNLFGDILTDEASMLSGSMGMMPSASLGAPGPDGRAPGLYEPIHGSAPDIAGRGVANPIGMILSAAMMLRISLGLGEAADAVEGAVEAVLGAGLRTVDMAAGGPAVSTVEMGTAIAREVAS